MVDMSTNSARPEPIGRRLVQALFPLAARAQQQALQGIAPDELAVFSGMLQRIFSNANGRGCSLVKSEE